MTFEALQARLYAAKTICRRCSRTYASTYHRMVCLVERLRDETTPYDRRTKDGQRAGREA